MDIFIPAKCAKVLWDPLRRRYRILYGGRGSAKSWSVARYLLLRASSEKLRVLCTREVQNSIKDSVYRLLVDQIYELQLQAFFIIKSDSIIGINGSEFIFKGLKLNIQDIKSTEGIDIVWVEEAERVSDTSWTTLIPTVRKEGSIIIITFNPDELESSTYTRFVGVYDDQGAFHFVDNPEFCRALVNYCDNPFFPKVLRVEMEWDRKNDPDKFEHVWMGNPKRYSDAVIFKNKIVIEEFEGGEGIQRYLGADFGYANDAAALVNMFIRDKKLFIEFEAYGVGVEVRELEAFFDGVPGTRRWKIRADSARPDTISHLKHLGFNIVGAEKGKGSVADGLEFLRSFEAIVIHPRCKGAIDNFGNYRWKQDRITNEILPIPVDKSNHVPDAARYALEPYIKAKKSIYQVL